MNTTWRTLASLIALVLLMGGQVARAGDGAPLSSPPAAAEVTRASSRRALGFSARSLAAQAEADLTAGHPGLAILGFERARLLAPRAPAVNTGLARALAAAGLPPAEASPGIRLARRFDANEWGWVAMAGLILGGAGLVAFSWRLIRRRGFLWLTLAGVGLASVGVLSAVAVTPPPDRAVVVAPDTVVRIAPFAGAEQAFVEPEGAVVTVERTFDHYTLIVGTEGRGWVPEGGVETILPATPKPS